MTARATLHCSVKNCRTIIRVARARGDSRMSHPPGSIMCWSHWQRVPRFLQIAAWRNFAIASVDNFTEEAPARRWQLAAADAVLSVETMERAQRPSKYAPRGIVNVA